MKNQNAAIAKLLKDDDPSTVQLVQEQLIHADDETLEGLQDLLKQSDREVAKRAREVLQRIAKQRSEDNFHLLCFLFLEHGEMESALWTLSRAVIRNASATRGKQLIDKWGDELAERLQGLNNPYEQIDALRNYMVHELGFHGNMENFYEEKNYLLPFVLKRRCGSPIMLTLIYQMVAARAGMYIEAINLPGHFIASYGDLFFDPFHQGQFLTLDDCAEILSKQNLDLQQEYLMPGTSRQILVRILANLLYIYDLKHAHAKHEKVHGWLKALTLKSE